MLFFMLGLLDAGPNFRWRQLFGSETDGYWFFGPFPNPTIG